jgi:segregation and condensation protein B
MRTIERFGWSKRTAPFGQQTQFFGRLWAPGGNDSPARAINMRLAGRHRVNAAGENARDTGSLAISGSDAGLSAAGSPDEDPAWRRKRVEAVLLLSRRPMPSRRLSQLAGLADATEARTLVRQLNQVYDQGGRAFRVEEVAGGFHLMTRPQLAPWLRRMGHIPKTLQLTPPAMETLAIIAYRQPVMRADIEAIRGVACGEILRQLMDRDLVRISGRSEELGRPYLYSTTKCFLQTFGLRGAEALPALDESDFELSKNPDWAHDSDQSDPSLDQQPVRDVPEEESDVSTAVANVELPGPECDDDASVGLFAAAVTAPIGAIDDEDDVFLDEDDDDFEDDDDWDDDDDEDDDEESDEVETDADWEEVEDDDEEEDDEEDDDWDEDESDEEEDDDDDDDVDDVDDADDDDDWEEDDDEEEWD